MPYYVIGTKIRVMKANNLGNLEPCEFRESKKKLQQMLRKSDENTPLFDDQTNALQYAALHCRKEDIKNECIINFPVVIEVNLEAETAMSNTRVSYKDNAGVDHIYAAFHADMTKVAEITGFAYYYNHQNQPDINISPFEETIILSKHNAPISKHGCNLC